MSLRLCEQKLVSSTARSILNTFFQAAAARKVAATAAATAGAAVATAAATAAVVRAAVGWVAVREFEGGGGEGGEEGVKVT